MLDYNWSSTISNKYKLESQKFSLGFSLEPCKILAFKALIINYLASHRSWEYIRNNGKNHYLRIIAEDLSKIKWLSDFGSDINKEHFSHIEIHVCIDANSIDKLDVISYQKVTTQGISLLIELTYLNYISKKVCNDIEFLYKRAIDSTYINNYVYQDFEMVSGNYYGYYDFGKIKIDFGAPAEIYSANRKIKCLVEYQKIICSNLSFQVPVIETIDSSIKINIALLQLFLRCSIDSKIEKGKYYSYSDFSNNQNLDISHLGSYVTVNRGIINTEYYDGIPSDTAILFKKFYNLNYDKQNTFIISCYSYAYANKLSQVQAITHYVIALENLAEYEFKKNNNIKSSQKISKKEKIYLLINKLFEVNIVSKDFVDYFYSVRCLYAHEGIANNRIKQDLLGVHDGDKMLQLYMEELSYSVLIQWLLVNN